MLGEFNYKSLALALALGMAFSPLQLLAEDAQALLNSAQQHFAKGDIKTSVIELKNALQEDPSLGAARHLLGRVYLQVGDGVSAEKELARAKALGIDGPVFQLDLAEAMLLQRKYQDVVDSMTPGPGGDARLRARAATLHGRALIGLQRPDEARTSLNKALAILPNELAPAVNLVRLDIMDGKMEAALDRLNNVLTDHPNDLESLLLRADLLRQSARLDEAIESYAKAAQVQARDPRTYMGLATSYLALGKLDIAEQEINKADKIQSGLVMVQYLRGVLEFNRKHFQKARDHLQRVLGVVPDHAPTLLLIGSTSAQLHDYQIAEEYLRRYLSKNPGQPQASWQLAVTRAQLGDYKGVIDVAEPLLETRAADVQILVLLGSAYMEMGDFQRGTDYLEQAVKLSPDAVQIRTQLAKGLLARGETDKAVIQLQSAVDQNHDSIHADVLLVLTHLRNKDYTKAEESARQFETRKPNDPIANNLGGLVCLAQNDLSKASKKFNEALSLDARFTTAESNLAKIDMLNKDTDAAEKRYKRILDIQPSDMNALLGLAAIAEIRNDKAGSVNFLEQAIAENPRNAQPGYLLANLYLNSNEPRKALNVANDLSFRFPDNAGTLKILARAQSASGENSSAVRTLERLVDKDATTDNLLTLASAQVAVKDTRGARLSINRILEGNPQSLRAKLALVTLALQEDNRDEALQLALEIQQAYPESSRGYQAEGTVRSLNGDHRAAAMAYQRAYKLGKNRTLVLRLTETYQKLKRVDDSITTLRDWLKTTPDDAGAHYLMGQIMQGQGRNREAIQAYETVNALSEGNAVVLNNLAWLYYVEHDTRALITAERAYYRQPDRPEITDTYGWILLNRGNDPERALTLLQSAYVKFPTNPEMGFHVAVALHELGRNQEALRTLRKILSERTQFGNRPDAQDLLRKLGG